MIRGQTEYLHNLIYRLNISAQNKFYKHELILSKLEENIKNRSQQAIEKEKNKLNLYEKSISAADPQKILDRGFTITKINGRAISKIKKAKSGDVVETKSITGTIKSTVN